MKRVLVRYVHEAFEYVMKYYYPYGFEEFVGKNDIYAAISIQDTHTGGFGFEFKENKFCKGVLALYIDDIYKEVEDTVLFNEEHANQIIDFILDKKDKIDTLLIHCYAGQSCSRAVNAFVMKMVNDKNISGNYNKFIYKTLQKVWEDRK